MLARDTDDIERRFPTAMNARESTYSDDGESSYSDRDEPTAMTDGDDRRR
jgi:hypothetical protein